MADGRVWTVQDGYGNEVYLTEERWQHIIAPTNHPDMARLGTELQETVRQGHRKQDALNPQKYRYIKAFDSLTDDNTHVVVIVLCRYREGERGQPEPNNYIVTAYQKEIG